MSCITLIAEITKDEDTGKTVIRAKSGASVHSKHSEAVLSRKSSQRSLVVDFGTGEISGMLLAIDSVVISITLMYITTFIYL